MSQGVDDRVQTGTGGGDTRQGSVVPVQESTFAVSGLLVLWSRHGLELGLRVTVCDGTDRGEVLFVGVRCPRPV